jgi:hypothetical protein
MRILQEPLVALVPWAEYSGTSNGRDMRCHLQNPMCSNIPLYVTVSLDVYSCFCLYRTVALTCKGGITTIQAPDIVVIP